MSYFIGFIIGVLFVLAWEYIHKPNFKLPFSKKEPEKVEDRKITIIDPYKK